MLARVSELPLLDLALCEAKLLTLHSIQAYACFCSCIDTFSTTWLILRTDIGFHRERERERDSARNISPLLSFFFSVEDSFIVNVQHNVFVLIRSFVNQSLDRSVRMLTFINVAGLILSGIDCRHIMILMDVWAWMIEKLIALQLSCTPDEGPLLLKDHISGVKWVVSGEGFLCVLISS